MGVNIEGETKMGKRSGTRGSTPDGRAPKLEVRWIALGA